MKISRKLLSALLLTTSFSAHAVIIDGTFSGVVTESMDISNTNKLIWGESIVGQAFSGSFSYDISLAPGDNWSAVNDAIYTSRTNWVEMIFNIGGRTFNITHDHPPELPLTEVADLVQIADHAIPINRDDYQHYSVYDKSIAGDYDYGDYELKTGLVGISDPINSSLDGLGLEQEISWVADGTSSLTGTAFFNIETILNGQNNFATANMDLTQIHIAARNTSSVPEPSSIALLTFALVGFAARRCRNLRQKR